jgi:hypothetical protein
VSQSVDFLIIIIILEKGVEYKYNGTTAWFGTPTYGTEYALGDRKHQHYLPPRMASTLQQACQHVAVHESIVDNEYAKPSVAKC